MPYSLRMSAWVVSRPLLLTIPVEMHETVPTVYRPYPRRQEKLTIYGCHCRGSIFSSDPECFPGLGLKSGSLPGSTNWANRSTLMLQRYNPTDLHNLGCTQIHFQCILGYRCTKMNHENSHRWQTDDRNISLYRTHSGLLSIKKWMQKLILNESLFKRENTDILKKKRLRQAKEKTISVQGGSVNIVLYTW